MRQVRRTVKRRKTVFGGFRMRYGWIFCLWILGCSGSVTEPHGNTGSNLPCYSSAECSEGLICNFKADQTSAPFGTGKGFCQSGPKCPPTAPFWADCTQETCPYYISRGVQFDGCTWTDDCAPGLRCDYSKPQPGFCGTCL